MESVVTFLQDVVPQVTSVPHITAVYILESYYLCCSSNEQGTEEMAHFTALVDQSAS